MFRPLKCLSSGRLVHAGFMVFLSGIHISTLIAGRMCLMYERNAIKITCTSLPDDEHLNGRNISKKLSSNYNINVKLCILLVVITYGRYVSNTKYKNCTKNCDTVYHVVTFICMNIPYL